MGTPINSFFLKKNYIYDYWYLLWCVLTHQQEGNVRFLYLVFLALSTIRSQKLLMMMMPCVGLKTPRWWVQVNFLLKSSFSLLRIHLACFYAFVLTNVIKHIPVVDMIWLIIRKGNWSPQYQQHRRSWKHITKKINLLVMCFLYK